MKKLFTLFAVAVMAFAAQANVLSVYADGEWYSGSIPVYGLWYDTPGTTQMIYPAEELTEMAGGQINEISFMTLAVVGDDYASYTVNFHDGEIQLALKEVDALGFEEEVFISGAQVVATMVPVSGEQLLTFVLDEPFQYNGGNLLMDVNINTPGGYGTTYFLGTAMVDEYENDLYYPSYFVNYGYSGDVYNSGLTSFLPAVEFIYEEGQVGPIEPTEKTDAPSSTKENYVYNDGNLYYNAYTVNLIETEPSTIYYRVGVMVEGDYVYGEWMEYTGELNFTEEGTYMIEAYAVADGKTESDHIWDGFTVSKMVDVEELFAGKSVANVRYFNLAGQEMQQANGLTIMVTTFTDGTQSAVKVVK